MADADTDNADIKNESECGCGDINEAMVEDTNGPTEHSTQLSALTANRPFVI